MKILNRCTNGEENYYEEVGFANELQEDAQKSPVIKFENNELKEKLMSFDALDLIVMKSEIGPPKKIIFVEKYDTYVSNF